MGEPLSPAELRNAVCEYVTNAVAAGDTPAVAVQNAWDIWHLDRAAEPVDVPCAVIADPALAELRAWVVAERAQDWTIFPASYGAGRAGAVEQVARLLGVGDG